MPPVLGAVRGATDSIPILLNAIELWPMRDRPVVDRVDADMLASIVEFVAVLLDIAAPFATNPSPMLFEIVL